MNASEYTFAHAYTTHIGLCADKPECVCTRICVWVPVWAYMHTHTHTHTGVRDYSDHITTSVQLRENDFVTELYIYYAEHKPPRDIALQTFSFQDFILLDIRVGYPFKPLSNIISYTYIFFCF